MGDFEYMSTTSVSPIHCSKNQFSLNPSPSELFYSSDCGISSTIKMQDAVCLLDSSTNAKPQTSSPSATEITETSQQSLSASKEKETKAVNGDGQVNPHTNSPVNAGTAVGSSNSPASSLIMSPGSSCSLSPGGSSMVLHGTSVTSGLEAGTNLATSISSSVSSLWSSTVDESLLPPGISTINGSLAFAGMSPSSPLSGGPAITAGPSHLFNNSLQLGLGGSMSQTGNQSQRRSMQPGAQTFSVPTRPQSIGPSVPAGPYMTNKYPTTSWSSGLVSQGSAWSPGCPPQGNTVGASSMNVCSWSGRARGNVAPLSPLGGQSLAGMSSLRNTPKIPSASAMMMNKYRRSTSYPGKGPFPQPPSFEITAVDENAFGRELLPMQQDCRTNGSSPLDNMRGIEQCIDMIRGDPQESMKGFMNCNPNTLQALAQLHGKNFISLEDSGLVLDDGHLVEALGAPLPMPSPSRSSPRSQSSDNGERYSRKVFVGGLPPDIDEEEITTSFRRFGPLVVDWPHKAESKSYFPPKGYAFLLFQDEGSVQQLIDACIQDDDKLYLCVSSPTIKDKPVQIRPWRLSDADFVLDATLPLDPRKTVFVGGVPRPLKAVELAMIMDRLYGGVCYAGIDTDPELKYPKGAGRVAFSNQQSYIAAISARFVQLQHGDIDKRVEVKPYVLDDQMCDECQGSRCGSKFAPFFCANVTCLQYYCEHCWQTIHSRPGREFHKPLVKEGAERPRSVPFRWC